jgi:ABC-type multidrug transport system fused ATPase/permease subunit
VTVAYLLSLLAFPIQLIGFVFWDLSGSLAGWQRVQAVFDADDHIEYGNELAIAGGAAQVRASSIDFAYDSEPVLSGLNLNIKAGTTLAVVGATASGKTTLCLLLTRLWDPDSGRIQLEGRDLQAFAGSELPKEISYVAQNTFLFDTTVRANITLDEPFSEAEITTAMGLARATSFIEELPDGLDTELGERGATLSGGQRQRLALARALVRKPRLMVLDDATSAVDPSVEAEILEALKAAELPSTVVVVAYRPSSIRLADEVVFLDEKRIVAHGTHIDLLDTSAGYASLVSAYEDEARRLRGKAL